MLLWCYLLDAFGQKTLFFPFPVPTQRLRLAFLDKAVRDKFSLHGCCCSTTALCSPTLPLLTRPGSDGDDTSLPHTTHPSSTTSIAGYTTGRTESAAGRPRAHPPTGAARSALPPRARRTRRMSPARFLLPVGRSETSRSPVKGAEEVSNVWRRNSAVWLPLGGGYSQQTGGYATLPS